MPRKVRKTITNYAKKRLNKEYKEKSRKKNVKTLTDADIVEQNKRKQASRTRLKEADPVGFRRKNNQNQRLYVARKKAQAMAAAREASQEAPEKGSFAEILVGTLNDVIGVLSHGFTSNRLVDAYVEMMVSDEKDEWIPLAFYAHFIDSSISTKPDAIDSLPTRILSKERIFVAASITDRSVGHVYLAIIFPKLKTVSIYDSFPTYTTNKHKENHINVILDQIYKQSKVEREEYKISHKKTPRQSDTITCSLYLLFVLTTVIHGNPMPSCLTENQLDQMRREILYKLLKTTENGTKSLKFIVE